MTKNIFLLPLLLFLSLSAVSHAVEDGLRDTKGSGVDDLCGKADFYQPRSGLGPKCRQATHDHRFQLNAVKLCAHMYHFSTEILLPCLAEISDKTYDQKDLNVCERIAGSDREEAIRCLKVYHQAANIDRLCPAAASSTKKTDGGPSQPNAVQ